MPAAAAWPRASLKACESRPASRARQICTARLGLVAGASSVVFGELLELPPDEDAEISSDVRILLVSGDFSREITTTVLWLNGFDGMDIR